MTEYSPSPRPAFDHATALRRAEVTRHFWGDAESGEVLDWIYVSSGLIHQLVFGVPAGSSFRHSVAFRTIFAADEVLHVLSGAMVLANPATGEAHRVDMGESVFFRRRRTVLKSLAAAGALAVPGLGIAACGGSSTPAPSSSAPQVKKGGTLRVALTGGSSSDTLEAQSAITTVDFARIFQLNEPLIGFGPDAHLVRILAEELTPSSDATSWVVRVRSGVTFHNGKPLTADDVIYSLKRVVNPKAPLPGAAPLAAVDIAGMKKLDSRTVRIPCHTPR
jgi:extracellular solute-binding protein (family 5)